MIDTLRSLWVWFAVGMLVLLALPTMALVRLFDRDPVHYHTGRLFRWIGQLTTRLIPTWKVTVTGDFPENPRKPYVFVANHQSLADIPLISRLPWEMKWVIKIELYSVPIFGWLLRLSGDIPVDRRDKRSRARVMTLAREVLENRCSVMLFPEGTRSRDGRLLRFSTGAFRLATKAQVPIIPLVVDGTQNALPKHSWRLGKTTHHMRLKVLPEVDPSDFDGDAEVLRNHVRDQIAAQLAEWRSTDRAQVDAMARGERSSSSRRVDAGGKNAPPNPGSAPPEEEKQTAREVKDHVNPSGNEDQ